MNTYLENEWIVFSGRVYKYIRRWEAKNRRPDELGESGGPVLTQHVSTVSCIGHKDSE